MPETARRAPKEDLKPLSLTLSGEEHARELAEIKCFLAEGQRRQTGARRGVTTTWVFHCPQHRRRPGGACLSSIALCSIRAEGEIELRP